MNLWLALLSVSAKLMSQMRPSRRCSVPFTPALKYQVSTSWSKMRGPPSSGRRQQQVQGRKVEAVRVGEMVVRAGIRIVRIPHRSRRAIVQRHTVEIVRARSGVRSRHGGIAESEPPLRRPRAPRVQPRVGLRIGGLPPLRRADPVLVVEARGEEPGELAARATGAEARLSRAATFAEVAAVSADLEALEFLARDDVDHARDGIGAVDRGGSVLEHLDVIDDREGNGVEVGAAADTGGRRLIDPPQPVHHHQRALGIEVAQIDLGGAGADAATVRGVAEVTGGVEFLVERLAAGGELL